MDTLSFKLLIKEYFKLSTGATAFVGLMEPHNYPIITQDNFVVNIRSGAGRIYTFSQINEDIFSRKIISDNNFRSLQTFENVDDFLLEIKKNEVYIYGHKK